MKKFGVVFMGMSLCLFGAGCSRPLPVSDSSPVSLHGHPLYLEFARTPAEQRLGLGGRIELGEDRGMLFIFPTTSTPAFWMQGMKIPIDLVWIENQRIVGIERDLTPPQGEEEPITVYPPAPIDRVLELSAGGALRYELHVGDQLTELP